MATITDTTTDANGNIIINVSSSADDAITLATAGTYSDKNIIFNITTPVVDFPEQVQSDWNQNDDSSKDYIKNRPFYSNEILQDEVELTLTDGKGTKDIYFASLDSQTSSTVRDVHIVMKRNGEIVFNLTGTADFVGYPVSSWMSASLKGTCNMYPSKTVSCQWNAGDWLFEIEGMDMSRLDGTYTIYCYSIDIKQISDTFISDTIARTSDVPIKLPNPYALTFTGAVTGSYDGSRPLTVDVPSGTDGKTAYQYAQEGGYTGTESEFAAKLAEEYIPSPAAATVGQTIVVKAVDEDGKPTEWEAIDLPTSRQTATDNDVIDALIENDLLCALVDEDGNILTDEFDNILV